MINRKAMAATTLAMLGACHGVKDDNHIAERSSAAAKSMEGPARLTCSDELAATTVLARHAKAYGDANQLRQALPRTLRLSAETEGQKGIREIVLDPRYLAVAQSIAKIGTAFGMDSGGFWETGPAGVWLRLRSNEAQSIAFEEWLLRRSYLTAYDDRRDSLHCADENGSLAKISYRLPLLGDPELVFDLKSGALLSASTSGSDGARVVTEFTEWSDVDAGGLRWPVTFSQKDPIAEATAFHLLENATGLVCRGVDDAPEKPSDCFAPPKPRLQFDWPAAGVVRVPFVYSNNRILFEAKVGDQKIWSHLDSGAGTTAIDSLQPIDQYFTPTLTTTTWASTQTVRLGLGELAAFSIGDLHLLNLPIASVPLPSFKGHGTKRPLILAGYSLFAGAIVRIDYAKRELVFAKANAENAAALIKPGSSAIPFRVANGTWLTDVQINGTAAPFMIDTGRDNGIDIAKGWADRNGLPGSYPTVETVSIRGAGAAKVKYRFFRLPAATLGPIQHLASLVRILPRSDSGTSAGELGNGMLSRCAAITFDINSRTMWLEPPCDRSSPESLSGWYLSRQDTSEPKDRPWVIDGVVVGGSAEKAGLAAGDRLLEVGRTPATLAAAQAIAAEMTKPAHSVVVVTYLRGGSRRKALLKLAPILAE